ncbi:MAG: hypothetical protein ACTSPI_11765, partial [Candidatus Heimdallarchaeaceae archaeon]
LELISLTVEDVLDVGGQLNMDGNDIVSMGALTQFTADQISLNGLLSAAGGIQTNAITVNTSVSLPNDSLSGDYIDDGTISNFASTGITDNASSMQFVIDDSSGNFSGNLTIDGTYYGNGGGISNVDAITLSGNTSNYFAIKLEVGQATSTLRTDLNVHISEVNSQFESIAIDTTTLYETKLSTIEAKNTYLAIVDTETYSLRAGTATYSYRAGTATYVIQ